MPNPRRLEPEFMFGPTDGILITELEYEDECGAIWRVDDPRGSYRVIFYGGADHDCHWTHVANMLEAVELFRRECHIHLQVEELPKV